MQTNIEISLARSNTYSLLSQIYLRGPVPELYRFIEAAPELANQLKVMTADAGFTTLQELDELAADHYHIFGLNVLPYESTFLEPNMILDGPVTERVLTDYWAAGFSPDTKSVSADHVGLELRFLGDLCKTEAEAEEDQRVDIANHVSFLQMSFLENHLLRWLPGLVQAICQQKAPFYTALAELTIDLIIDHYQNLSERVIRQNRFPKQDFQLPELPDLLADENTGLKDIARFFLKPAYTGVYLSREIIEGMAKKLKLPRGFGDRETMLTNLLRNAADYDYLPLLLDNFQSILNSWTIFYSQLPQRCNDASLLNPYINPWRERIRESQKLLTLISSAVYEKRDG